jgi:hypothetical protein
MHSHQDPTTTLDHEAPTPPDTPHEGNPQNKIDAPHGAPGAFWKEHSEDPDHHGLDQHNPGIGRDEDHPDNGPKPQ